MSPPDLRLRPKGAESGGDADAFLAWGRDTCACPQLAVRISTDSVSLVGEWPSDLSCVPESIQFPANLLRIGFRVLPSEVRLTARLAAYRPPRLVSLIRRTPFAVPFVRLARRQLSAVGLRYREASVAHYLGAVAAEDVRPPDPAQPVFLSDLSFLWFYWALPLNYWPGWRRVSTTETLLRLASRRELSLSEFARNECAGISLPHDLLSCAMKCLGARLAVPPGFLRRVDMVDDETLDFAYADAAPGLAAMGYGHTDTRQALDGNCDHPPDPLTLSPPVVCDYVAMVAMSFTRA